MKLVDLDPRWVSVGGEDVSRINPDGTRSPIPLREKIGVSCDCPCGCDSPMFIPFANPEDGGPATHAVAWRRTGTTFETLTVTPSIQRRKIETKNGPVGCAWHGFLTDGVFRTA